MRSRKLQHLLLFLFVLLLQEGCGYIGAGTLGGFPPVTFPTSKNNLEQAIDSLYEDHPEYRIPEKWKDKDTWDERGYDFLESNIFYFSSEPEEMYYVTFIGGDDMDEISTATIAIRAVDSDTETWTIYDELKEVRRKEIEKRFHDEIISKLEKYSGTKSHIGFD